MEMTGPIGANALDTRPDGRPSGLVGQPYDRIEGPLKVTGRAPYAFEVRDGAAPLYGHAVLSTVGKARIAAIDTAAAEASPGVKLVLTHKNAPEQATGDHRRFAPQLNGPEVRFSGEPVAFVVADGFEQARAAAFLVRVRYEGTSAEYELARAAGKAAAPPEDSAPPQSSVGEFDLAFAAAPMKLDATYTTPHQSHAMMEPHATLAMWDGDRLTVHTSNQMPNRAQVSIGNTLKMPKENVRIVSPYVGGGFGGKLWVEPDAILAAIAARMLGRPVKVALTRQQVFQSTKHRSETIQRVRIGADRDGRILAIGHDSLAGNTPGQTQFEAAALQTRSLYAGANRQTRHRLAPLDIAVASSMRAPGEAVGLLALECAMDELAETLGLDPIELRIRNEPTEDPEKHVPYSTRNLVPCLRDGAERFGWSNRNPRPGQVRDGRWLVGMGVAAAIRQNPLQPSQAMVRLDADGVLTVRMAMTDIGTGTYTILTQIAAEMLGLPMDNVKVVLGDTDDPPAAGSGGSFGAASSGSALFDACQKLRGTLAAAAGVDPGAAELADGRLRAAGTEKTLAELLGGKAMEARGEIKPGDMTKRWSQQSYGAHFAEVGVDMDTGEIRLRRMLGVFTAGRILNAKTARSQAIGGMIFGVGAALTEEAVFDRRDGGLVNRDLAEYHVPVHADVPEVDAYFLPELDDKANPLKSKGIGELGICGAGAAVANAAYNACGVRVRDYPLTLDKILAKMPQQA